jgi:hypothetical protein
MSLKKDSIMKNARIALLALVTAAAAVPALAETASGVTREQVKAEYVRALKAGELDFAREFVTPASVSRQAANNTAATKVEDLSPTAAGPQSAAVSTVKTAN